MRKFLVPNLSVIGSSILGCSEAPKDSYFLHTRNDVPLKTEFKPAVKVLSRKPTPKAAGVADLTGLQQLNLEDEDDDDDNDSGKTVMTLEERQQKALLEREEKQKKYEEVRQRLFGPGGSSESQPGESSTFPPQQNGAARGRSKSRGGRDTRPSPSTGNASRQLFDPNSTAKPDSAYIQKKESPPKSGSSTPVKQQIIRNPRNPPENTGTASFGFMPREGI